MLETWRHQNKTSNRLFAYDNLTCFCTFLVACFWWSRNVLGILTLSFWTPPFSWKNMTSQVTSSKGARYAHHCYDVGDAQWAIRWKKRFINTLKNRTWKTLIALIEDISLYRLNMIRKWLKFTVQYENQHIRQ